SRHRRTGGALGHAELAGWRRRRRAPRRQRVVAHALRARLLRRAAGDQRHLRGHDPVVRAARARGARGGLRADRAGDPDSRGAIWPHAGHRRMKGLVAALAVVALGACARGAAETMPPFTLVDQSGAAVTSDGLRGRVLVVSFVFTTCRDACPLITAQLARVQARARAEKLDARVRFVSITLDPATDTPEALRRYAAAYGIDLASWHLLTGAPASRRGVLGDGAARRPGGLRRGVGWRQHRRQAAPRAAHDARLSRRHHRARAVGHRRPAAGAAPPGSAGPPARERRPDLTRP